MKTETVVGVTTNKYTCEICGGYSSSSRVASNCERRCRERAGCEHEFKYIACLAGDGSDDIEVTKECSKCGLEETRQRDVDDLDGELAEKLFNLDSEED